MYSLSNSKKFTPGENLRIKISQRVKIYTNHSNKNNFGGGMFLGRG